MSDLQTTTNDAVLQFFGSATVGLSPSTQAAYGRAVSAFASFVNAHGLSISRLSQTMAIDWYVHLLRKGLSPKTAKNHIDILASLVNMAARAGILPPTDALKKAKTHVAGNETAEPASNRGWSPAVVDRFLTLMRMQPRALEGDNGSETHDGTGAGGGNKTAVWRDVILLSLLNGAPDLVDAARLTKDSARDMTGEAAEVVARNVSATRRKYVFDLGQSAMTPAQFARLVHDNTVALLRDRVSLRINDAATAVRAVWVELAMRSGATASVALGCQPQFACPTLPAAAIRGQVTHTLRRQIVQAVAPAVVNNPLQWFAMRLRPHVSADDLTAHIDRVAADFKPAATFYPQAEIMKAVGKKRVTQQKPFIADVLFFKSRMTDVAPLFARIGDKAWCYRLSNTADAPYATIPAAQMMQFQVAIGRFTADTQIHPLDTVTLAPGDRVVVLGGLFAGQTGTVDRPVTDRRTGRTLYKVILCPGAPGTRPQGFEWLSPLKVRADLDPRQLSPAP